MQMDTARTKTFSKQQPKNAEERILPVIQVELRTVKHISDFVCVCVCSEHLLPYLL